MRILILLCVTITAATVGLALPEPHRVLNREGIIREIIERAGAEQVNPALALAIVEIESTFNPRAIRHEVRLNTASVGLFQVLHTTARGFKFKGSIEDLMEPIVNIKLGLRYLKRCGPPDDLAWIACCYQSGFAAKKAWCAGDERVIRYHEKLKTRFHKWVTVLAFTENE